MVNSKGLDLFQIETGVLLLCLLRYPLAGTQEINSPGKHNPLVLLENTVTL